MLVLQILCPSCTSEVNPVKLLTWLIKSNCMWNSHDIISALSLWHIFWTELIEILLSWFCTLCSIGTWREILIHFVPVLLHVDLCANVGLVWDLHMPKEQKWSDLCNLNLHNTIGFSHFPPVDCKFTMLICLAAIPNLFFHFLSFHNWRSTRHFVLRILLFFQKFMSMGVWGLDKISWRS